mmetsp:Transcript_31911/g.69854  ORF Transcript_31911/g.69854 Transcript_31911/m.69854 type:complete len:892 (+) Transcript_31911:77-2752(+)
MEVVPKELFVRQVDQFCKLVSLLQRTAPPDAAHALHSVHLAAVEIRDSTQLPHGSVKVPTVDRVDYQVRDLVRRHQDSGRSQARSPPPAASERGVLFRVDDMSAQLDGVLHKLSDVRQEVESSTNRAKAAEVHLASLASEFQRMKLDIRDTHDAIVTHDHEMKDLHGEFQGVRDHIQRVLSHQDGEIESQRKLIAGETAEIRAMVAQAEETLDNVQRSLRQGIVELEQRLPEVEAGWHRRIAQCQSALEEDVNRCNVRVDAAQTAICEQSQEFKMMVEGVREQVQRVSSSQEGEIEAQRKLVAGETGELRAMIGQAEENLEGVQRSLRQGIVELEQRFPEVEAGWHRRITQCQSTLEEDLNRCNARVDGVQSTVKEQGQELKMLAEDVSRQNRHFTSESERLEGQVARATSDLRSMVDSRFEEQSTTTVDLDRRHCALASELDQKLKDVTSHCQWLSKECQSNNVKHDESIATLNRWITCARDETQEVRRVATSADTNLKAAVSQIQDQDVRIDVVQSALSGQSQELKRLIEDSQRSNRQFATESERLEGQIARSTADLRSILDSRFEEQATTTVDLDRRHSSLVTDLDQRIKDVTSHCQWLSKECQSNNMKSEESVATLNRWMTCARDEAQEARRLAAAAEGNVKAAVSQLQDQDLRTMKESSNVLRRVTSHLFAGILKVTQLSGLCNPGEPTLYSDSPSSPRKRLDGWFSQHFETSDGVDALQLLDWEAAGTSLAARIEKAWLPQCTAHERSIVSMLQKKAEHSTVKLLQMAVRDMDVRLSHLKGEREAWKDFSLSIRAVPAEPADPRGGEPRGFDARPRGLPRSPSVSRDARDGRPPLRFGESRDDRLDEPRPPTAPPDKPGGPDDSGIAGRSPNLLRRVYGRSGPGE